MSQVLHKMQNYTQKCCFPIPLLLKAPAYPAAKYTIFFIVKTGTSTYFFFIKRSFTLGHNKTDLWKTATEKNRNIILKEGNSCLLPWLGWEKGKESKQLKIQVHHLVTVTFEFSWLQKLLQICDKVLTARAQ